MSKLNRFAPPRSAFRAPRLGLLLVLLIGLLPVAASAAPAADPVVRPDPLKSSVAVGDTITIYLYVQDVTDLYGADVRLSFDPQILQVVDDAPATAGVQITPVDSFLKPDFVVRKKACNGADPADPDCTGDGLVWYAATQVNPSQPVSGSGPIAAVRFRRVKAGDAVLTVIHNELVTRTGATIVSQARNGILSTGAGSQRHMYLPMLMR